MNNYSYKQRGATLVMAAIFMVVLVGVAALALDLGRLFVLRTEVQNAVDAAALAAAAELDSGSDARLRAQQASRELFVERGIFLGEFTAGDDLPDSQYTFYSSINPVKVAATSDVDARFVDITIDLRGAGEGIPLFFLPVLEIIVDDVPTEQGLAARALAGRQTIICIKPPFLMCVDDVADFNDDESNWPIKPGEMVRLRQHGGKGSSWLPGNFAFLIPEGAGGAGGLSEFLAGSVKEACTPPVISSAPGQKAQPSRRGFNTRFDIYDKFDSDEFPPAPNIIDYPRDNDILDAIKAGEEAPRIGDGIWNSKGYYETYHGHQLDPLDPYPSGWDDNNGSVSRYTTYQWELGLIKADGSDEDNPGEKTRIPAARALTGVYSTPPEPDPLPMTTLFPLVDDELGLGEKLKFNCDYELNDKDYLPTRCHGEPRPENLYCLDSDTICKDNYNDHLYDDSLHFPNPQSAGEPPPPKTEGVVTGKGRRVMYVAALDCGLLNLSGSIKDLEVTPQNGKFLEFFMTQHAEEPGPSPDKFELYSEFIRVADDKTGNVRVVIQLYE